MRLSWGRSSNGSAHMRTAAPRKGVIQNKHPTDDEYPLPPSRVFMSLMLNHVPIWVECLISLTLLPAGMPGGGYPGQMYGGGYAGYPPEMYVGYAAAAYAGAVDPYAGGAWQTLPATSNDAIQLILRRLKCCRGRGGQWA